MKIEVGEKYIGADGKIVKIIDIIEESSYMYGYLANNYSAYSENGQVREDKISKKDLICEIVPSIYALYKGGIIDLKELIKQHIEYYTK